jgi:hypothetical protein
LKRKKASEIFAQVDPELKVIDGGRRKSSIKSPKVALSSDADDWEKLEGAKCPECGQDRLRFRPYLGVCEFCAQTMDEKAEKEAEKRAKILKSIKAHNERIDRQRGRHH